MYYVVYVGGVALGLARYWPQLTAHDGILWLAAIFGASAGSALLVAIFLEVMGRMVLLIPAAWKKIKDKGYRRVALKAGPRAALRAAPRNANAFSTRWSNWEIKCLLKSSTSCATNPTGANEVVSGLTRRQSFWR